MENKDQKPTLEQHIRVENHGRRANEGAALNIDEFVRIFDPETQESHLEKRA